MIHGGTLQVEDITQEITGLLNEYGLAAITSNKVYQLNNSSKEGRLGEVRYLGTLGGVEKLAEIINEYAEAFQVTGILAPPMKMSLHDGRSAYLCYLSFTPAGARIIDKMIKANIGNVIKEGEIPNE